MVIIKKFDVGNVSIAKKFDIFESLSKYFDIYSKIIFRDAEIFFRHQSELVLLHQIRVSNYFVKFFYSVTLRFFQPGTKLFRVLQLTYLSATKKINSQATPNLVTLHIHCSHGLFALF
jgi:hypothetical protein